MAFAHQVGGHADTILASPLSSSTLIKPASERELAFYQSLGPTLAGGDFVQRWTPAFYGTLKAHAPPAAAAAATPGAPASTPAPPDMLVLENLTHRFQRPNVLDIKLGTQLYDEDASDEKKERMQRASEASTSGTTGIRLTGFQVWNHATQAYVQTEKAFGKSLAVDELDLGLARFFHPSQSRLSRAEQAALAATAPAAVEEDAPIASTSAAPIPASAPTSTTSSSPPSPPNRLDSPSSSSTPASLPLDLLLPVLRTLVRRLNQLIEVWQTLEIRMRGGSLLVVVEGDPDALERAILRSCASSSSSDDPALNSQQHGDGDKAEDDDDDAESVSTTDEEGNAKPETLLPLEMRLIDFAHTRSAVGEGPDEGVLLGLRTVQSLLEALTAKLEQQQREEDQQGERSSSSPGRP